MPELESVQVPPGSEWLYNAFWELCGGDGIRYSEIESYMRLTGHDLNPEDVAAIKAMDAEYQAFVANKAKESKNA